MSILADMKGIERQQAAVFFAMFLGFFSPGFLILFRFWPELFQQCDVFKLSLLSISITLPIPVFNIMLSAVFSGFKKEEAKGTILTALTFSGLGLHVILYWSYVERFDFRTFSYLVVCAEVLLLFIAFFREIRAKKEAKKKSQSTSSIDHQEKA